MPRLLYLSLPSVGVFLEYNFDRMKWEVKSTSPYKVDGVYASIDPIPCTNQELAYMVGDFESAWAYMTAMAKKVSPTLLAVTTPPKYEAVSLLAFGDEPLTECAYTFWGTKTYFNDAHVEMYSYQLENILYNLLAVAPKDKESAQLVLGAINGCHEKVCTVQLEAYKTLTSVKWDTLSKEWVKTDKTAVGKPIRTSVGVTAYIDGEISDDVLSQVLPVGFDYLAQCEASLFSVDLIKGKDLGFRLPDPTNVVERALTLDSNERCLVFYLNTDHKEVEPEFVEAELPEIIFSPTGGKNYANITCGGAVKVRKGYGAYKVETVLEVLLGACEKYLELADPDMQVSEEGLNEYNEVFGQYRTKGLEPSHTAPMFQVSDGVSFFGWDDAVWSCIYGDVPPYPSERRGPGELMFNYLPHNVTMSAESWALLISSFISTFQLPVPGLAALYYKTHAMPEPEVAMTFDVRIVDPLTMHICSWSPNGYWAMEEVNTYTNDGVMFGPDFMLSVSGSGSMPSELLAKVMAGAPEAFTQLCAVRAADKERIGAASLYGSYDLIHQFLPTDTLRQAPYVRTNALATPDAPVVFVDPDRNPLIHTSIGWVNSEFEPSGAGIPSGVGEVFTQPGSISVEQSLRKLLVDYLEYYAYTTDKEEVLVAYELAMANK